MQLSVPQVAPPTHNSPPRLSSVLSPAVSSATTTYLLENGEVQVGAEEVISEEVVTDDPVVVLESTDPQVVQPTDHILSDIENLTSSGFEKERVATTIVSSSSLMELSPPPPKVPAMDTPGSIAASVSLDSSKITQLSEASILTTHASSHFSTETTSDSKISLTSPSSNSQFIDNSLKEISPSKSPSKADLLVANDIIEQMLAPPSSDKLVVDQGGVVEIDEPSVTMDSEVVISEPTIVNVLTTDSCGEGLDEPVVLLLKEDNLSCEENKLLEDEDIAHEEDSH